MSKLLNSSGSDQLGVANFYNKTGRISARMFEDQKALSFIDSNDFEIKDDLAYFHEACPICTCNRASEIFNKDGYHHQICEECNFIYVNPCLKQDVINNHVYGDTEYPFFEAVNSESQRAFDKIRFESVIDFIKESFPEKTSIYDIGCGSGYFLKLCEENGFQDVAGIDALKKAQEYGYDVLNLKQITYGDYKLAAELGKKYDVIAMWEILDHVVDPKELMRIADSILKPGGLIVISVRNGFSLAARVLRERCNMFLGYAHTNFWNTSTFNLIGEEFNLKMIQLRTYISELSAVNNFLQYQDPYSSTTTPLDFLPSQEEVIDGLHGYKFIAIMQKKY